MKPKLVVKTTKGHRYLQLLDIHGHLIHIGSADKAENWCVANRALQDNYEALAFKEAWELDHEKAFHAYAIERVSEAWERYCKKRIDARVKYEFVLQLVKGVPEDKALQELVDYRTNLEVSDEISKKTGLSPELLELLEVARDAAKGDTAYPDKR
jgi:hypothetical protein